MKIAIIGATGFVGPKLVNEAIDRNLEVTAIARNVDKITQSKVNKIAVDVNNHEALSKALNGHDVVISAFNAGWENPNIYDDFITGSIAIQQAVKKSGVKRMIVVGGAGSLYLNDTQQLVDTPDFPENIKQIGRASCRERG